jgi:colicin import membrane protein
VGGVMEKAMSEDDVNTNENNPVTDRVIQFLDVEGERIRQETERIQSPIIAKARQEYKQRLSDFLKEESDKLKKETEKEIVSIKEKAHSEASIIISQAHAEKNNMLDETQKQIVQLLDEARKQAIIDRDKIILEKQNEATQFAEETKQQAIVQKEQIIVEGRKEAEIIIDKAKQEASQLMAEVREVARKNTEADCELILNESRKKAHEQSQAIITDTWHRSQQLLDSAECAYNLVRTQLQECVKVIIEADSKMEIVVSPNSNAGYEEQVLRTNNHDMELFTEKSTQ